jgi:uncharacterized membrane protein required for colicin V production
MNWTDITVLIIILAFTIIGVKNGFLYSVYNLLSYILSVIFAIKFYPVLSGMLQQTVIYKNVKTSVVNGITNGQTTNASNPGVNPAQSIVDSLKLPDFLKNYLSENLKTSGILDDTRNKIIDYIGSEIAGLVINILSLILIYLIIRIAMMFIKVIIKTISRLPVFKQLDKTGGLVLGAIEGILVVYILCALLILFSAFPKFAQTIDSIEASRIASYFYQNNFIVSRLWMSPTSISGGTDSVFR